MKRTELLLTMGLLAGMLPAGMAQTAPAHPTDPTGQAPATTAPATPPTFPEDKSKAKPIEEAAPQSGEASPQSPASEDKSPVSAEDGQARVFMGVINQGQGGLVLKAGDVEYKLDNQDEAKKFDQKNVKVMGVLDRQSNIIKVTSIEASPSM